MQKSSIYSLVLILVAALFLASTSFADTNIYLPRIPGAKITNSKGTKVCASATEANCNATTFANGSTVICDPATDIRCTSNITPLGICDPKADPTLDGDDSKPLYQKSCSGQGITRSNFKVKVTFDPKQPTTKADGSAWTGVNTIVTGAVTLPMCNTSVSSNQNAETCNATLCPYSTVSGNTITNNPNNCTPLLNVADVDGNVIAVTGKTFIYSGIGGQILYNNSPIYFPSTTLTYPTSGNVQAQLMSGGVAVTTKCKDVNGDPTQSARQPTTATDRCDAGAAPILDGSNQLITTAVPVLTNLVYTQTRLSTTTSALTISGNSIIPTVTSDGVSSCTIGGTQQYIQDKYVRDANCIPMPDIYNPSYSSNSPVYIRGGGIIYDTSGQPSKVTGTKVLAVAGSSTTINVPGSLYNLVFSNNSADLKRSIMNLPGTSKEILAGSTDNIIYPETLVSFDSTYEGNQLCVYAYEQKYDFTWRVEKSYPQSLNEIYGSISSQDMDPSNQPSAPLVIYSEMPTAHCVDAPPVSINNSPLTWGISAISPICTNYDSSNSKFKDKKGKNRAFTGVVVECIEESMMSILYPTITGSGQPTFFSTMQNNLKSLIRTIMALYVIVFGYKILISKKGPKKEEWMWVFLKIALVTYFAIGSGMLDLLPKLLTVSKHLSIIVMDAGLGVATNPQLSAAQSTVSTAYTSYNTAQTAVDNAVRTKNSAAILLRNASANLSTLNAEVSTGYTDVNSARDSNESSLSIYNAALAKSNLLNANYATQKTNLQNQINAAKAAYGSAYGVAQIYTSAGAYTVPSFCKTITAQVWGGGGAGYVAGPGGDGDAAGGGGGYAYAEIPVSVGNSISITLGSGGNSYQASGAQSTITKGSIQMIAGGGHGGVNGGNSPGGVASCSGVTCVLEPGGPGGNSHGALESDAKPGGATHCIAGGSPTCNAGVYYQQPYSECASSGSKAQYGGGGCSYDRKEWGKGGDGKSEIKCSTFDFTDLNNISNITPDAVDAANIKALVDQLTAMNATPASILDAQSATDEAYLDYTNANEEYTQNIADYCTAISNLRNQQYTINPSATLQAIPTDPINCTSIVPASAGCIDPTGTYCDLQTLANQNIATLQTTASEAKTAYDTAVIALNNLIPNLEASGTISASNTGYAYCDFRSYIYPSGKEYMQLWDMIDCKFSKYLGVGDNAKVPDAPQVFMIAILAPLTIAYGIPIFFFAIIFTAIVIMIIVRVVHMYIMAFIGLIILVYISPLVIPSVLFKFTDDIYKRWLTQLSLFWLQPIILFAFLSFMFVGIDTVMFGGNHYFSPDNKVVNTVGEITSDNKGCDDEKCSDTSAVGYIVQTLKIEKGPWPSPAFYIMDFWRMSFGSDGGKTLFIGYAKLMILILIIYSVLGIAERISGTLIAGFGILASGVAAMSSAPVASPSQVMGGMISGVSSAVGVADKAASAAKHYNSSAKAVKRAVLDNPAAKAIKGGYAALKGGSAALTEASAKIGDLRAAAAVSKFDKDHAGEKAAADKQQTADKGEHTQKMGAVLGDIKAKGDHKEGMSKSLEGIRSRNQIAAPVAEPEKKDDSAGNSDAVKKDE